MEVLHFTFQEYQQKTNDAIKFLHDSKQRLMSMRGKQSITENPAQLNIFSTLAQSQAKHAQEVFGSRGKGIF